VDQVHGAVDRQCTRVHSGPRTAPCWHTGARAHRSSPVVAKGDKGDEAVPEGRSPKHEQR
jgi:hypothetical protein